MALVAPAWAVAPLALPVWMTLAPWPVRCSSSNCRFAVILQRCPYAVRFPVLVRREQLARLGDSSAIAVGPDGHSNPPRLPA